MQLRLRELTIIYIVLFGMTIVWRKLVVGLYDPTVLTVNALVILTLGGIAALLSGRRPFSLARLEDHRYLQRRAGIQSGPELGLERHTP